ncbi:L-aspartate oxidase [Caulobacter sp. S45]|uniref:L-aspartate oxidase n=1 Tax=Caulobacter sp. S45 TaxID=1641861 RepID=UPI00131E26E9|nr:L-aspartate oxidase [Caulobacter sp. S45]
MKQRTMHRDGAPIVIGAGAAGLSAALRLAEYGPVTVLCAADLGQQAASAWAQGGVAAAVGADDAPELHAQDTLAAGDGLCAPEATRRITAAGPSAVDRLAEIGARFDRAADGSFKLGLEAAHSRRRIVHAQGDGTGREVLRALVEAAVRTRNIILLERIDARRLLLDANGAVAGVLAADRDGTALTLRSGRVVIATGGLGGLYAHTTNPSGALGLGLAMAARAGAVLADMEFVQFHPTALDVGLDPMPLVSEAVRGEGAILVNDLGERFMAGHGRAELEPRDVVARAVWAELTAGRKVFLDAREALGERFAVAFPSITAACLAAGVDPALQPIPIRPAAHYHMGGIGVDAHGRSTVAGLWACGEAASTGLHGANRLASNSLLEAAVCGEAVARDVACFTASAGTPRTQRLPPRPEPGVVRAILDAHAGVLRDATGLQAALAALRPLAFGEGPQADPALAALFIVIGALARLESRGGHFRTDYPAHVAVARSSRLALTDLLAEPVAVAA